MFRFCFIFHVFRDITINRRREMSQSLPTTPTHGSIHQKFPRWHFHIDFTEYSSRSLPPNTHLFSFPLILLPLSLSLESRLKPDLVSNFHRLTHSHWSLLLPRVQYEGNTRRWISLLQSSLTSLARRWLPPASDETDRFLSTYSSTPPSQPINTRGSPHHVPIS